jgi:hypothetical protein
MNNHLIPTSISSPPLIPNKDISNEVIQFIEDTGSSKINLLKELLNSITKIGQEEILNINASIELWKLPCGFIRKAGDVIHLYERSDGTKFWSIIGPQEWENDLSSLGSYRILYDYILEKI